MNNDIEKYSLMDGLLVGEISNESPLEGMYCANKGELIVNGSSLAYNEDVLQRIPLTRVPLRYKRLKDRIVQEVLYNLSTHERKPELVTAVAVITRSKAVVGKWFDHLSLFEEGQIDKPLVTYTVYDTVTSELGLPSYFQSYMLTSVREHFSGEAPFWLDELLHRAARRVSSRIRRWRQTRQYANDVTGEGEKIAEISEMMVSIYEEMGSKAYLKTVITSTGLAKVYSKLFEQIDSLTPSQLIDLLREYRSEALKCVE